jgi:hypothetical protein
MDDTQAKIRESYRNLDINSQESELEAAIFVDEMSGDGDETDPSDVNIPDSMPLPAALTLVETSHADGFQFMKEIAEQMLAKFSAKSEDVKATQDSRTLNHQMAMGVKALLVEWGARVAEAEERLKQTTPDERRKIGVDVEDILQGTPVNESSNRAVGVPSANVQSNTKRAQEWLKSDATRN